MWKNEYSFIVGQVFYAIREWANADLARGLVTCLFESGDDGQSQASAAAQEILKAPSIKEEYRISSFAWAAQNEETHLQAADMLAWHLNLWRARRRRGDVQRRGDFNSLLEVPTVYHHWDGSAVDLLASLRTTR